MNNFEEIDIKNFTIDPFELKNKWMLISAQKTDGSVNTMTASWGGFGIMWNKNVVFIFIRPQRYTKEFVDISDSFSLTFFDESYKKALAYLGKASGRDEDKINKSGLTVVNQENVPYFEEAELTIIAKKLFVQPLSESSFLTEKEIKQWYPEKDFHYMYIAEITKVLRKS